MKLPIFVIALAIAAPALAKDVCVVDQLGRDYRFENPKLPKKPGKMTTIIGAVRAVPAQVDPFSWGPLSGSAMFALGTEDLAVVSFFAQTLNVSFSVRVTVDRTFDGFGVANFDGDATLDEEVTFTPIDCAASTLP